MARQQSPFVRQLYVNDALVCASLVFLDMNLPRADGFEVLVVCETARDAGSIPVMVMTSSAALADRTSGTALTRRWIFCKGTQL